jgi:hypothetical protein
MSKLPHIYRHKKLTNISQRRYKRKYNPEYLEEKASHGASIKLGFGDFDGDGDLDGLYPKQRAGVAEKPGLHVDPPRGPFNTTRLAFAEPIFGPTLMVAAAVVPQAGPVSLGSSIAIPAAGPLELGTGEVAPQLGPESVTSTTVIPEVGPSSLNLMVVAPQLGPSSLETVDLAPDVGPINLSSTVVVPVSGPSQLSGIASPAAGPLNLSSDIIVPTTGITGLTSDTVKPNSGVSDLGVEIKSFFASESSITYSDPSNMSLSTDGNTIAFVGGSKGLVYERSDSSGQWTVKGDPIESLGKARSSTSTGETTRIHISGDGNVVAVSNDWFDGGATYSQETNNNGNVEIFRWDASQSRWGQDTIDDVNQNNTGSTYIMGDGEYEHLGRGVALNKSGTYIVVGSDPQNVGSNRPGYFKVFQYNSSKWVHKGSVYGTSSNWLATSSVSITEDGSKVLHTDENMLKNSVWEWDGVNSEYIFVEDILNAYGYTSGSSFSTHETRNKISEDGTIVAASGGNISENYGQRTVIEKWNASLSQYRPYGDFNFGNSLAMSNDGSLLVIVNALYGSAFLTEDGSVTDLDSVGWSSNDSGGQVIIYRDKGSGTNPWELVTEINGVRRTGTEPTKNDVGKSVAISGDGNTVAVQRHRAGRIDVLQMPAE